VVVAQEVAAHTHKQHTTQQRNVEARRVGSDIISVAAPSLPPPPHPVRSPQGPRQQNKLSPPHFPQQKPQHPRTRSYHTWKMVSWGGKRDGGCKARHKHTQGSCQTLVLEPMRTEAKAAARHREEGGQEEPKPPQPPRTFGTEKPPSKISFQWVEVLEAFATAPSAAVRKYCRKESPPPKGPPPHPRTRANVQAHKHTLGAQTHANAHKACTRLSSVHRAQCPKNSKCASVSRTPLSHTCSSWFVDQPLLFSQAATDGSSVQQNDSTSSPPMCMMLSGKSAATSCGATARTQTPTCQTHSNGAAHTKQRLFNVATRHGCTQHPPPAAPPQFPG
jgi:hypothetical protein